MILSAFTGGDMIKRMLLLFGLVLTINGLMGQDWQLVWSDEFDGSTLDTTKWSYQTGTGTEYGLTDWGNAELQYYRERNIEVGDGFLHVIAKQESYGGKGYTSGRIRSINKGDWTYGRIEFRAKVARGQGFWSAVWMLPTDEEYGGWAASGELDIMENVGYEPLTVHGTLHFGGSWPNNESKGTYYNTQDWPFWQEFYEYALEWEEGEIRWYVNDFLYQTLGQGDWRSSGYPFPAPFDKRFHLLINLAVGGYWPGSPDGTTTFPQEMVLDYVRVYQDASTGLKPETSALELNQNHPNPFGDYSTIEFSLLSEKHILLEVYDAMGRKVRTMADQSYGPGDHQLGIEADQFVPGIYFYRLQAGSNAAIRQMVIL
jgi:beta-glucanase (GH16 family)